MKISIEYTVADPEVSKNELFGKAVKDSLKKVSVLAEASDVKLEKIINIRYERQNLPRVLLKIFKATGELVYYSVGKKVVNKPVDGFYLLYYMHLEVESDYGLS